MAGSDELMVPINIGVLDRLTISTLCTFVPPTITVPKLTGEGAKASAGGAMTPVPVTAIVWLG